MAMLAPKHAVGKTQIIPSRGPHSQVYVEDDLAYALVTLGLINYDPDYGPNARVYRPTRPANEATVRSWLAH